jgi:predicted HAD superfamily Cof-like phosphohydrolase
MITNAIDAVKEFNEAFKIKYSKNQKADLDESTIELRYRLMQEENDEYLEAARKKDLVEIADALGDKLYILCGTILAHGLQDKIVEVFDEIQRSNMSKLSTDGTPVIREDGKILKGPNYFKPNIKSILEKYSVEY